MTDEAIAEVLGAATTCAREQLGDGAFVTRAVLLIETSLPEGNRSFSKVAINAAGARLIPWDELGLLYFAIKQKESSGG